MTGYLLAKRISGILLTLLLIMTSLSCHDDFHGTHVVTTFHPAKGRVIEILADNFYDNGQGFYYQVTVDNRIDVHPSLIWFGDEDNDQLHFITIGDGKADVIGLAEEKSANTILALHDFSSGQSWPGCLSDSPQECRKKAASLLDKLQKEHPSVRLSLRGG